MFNMRFRNMLIKESLIGGLMNGTSNGSCINYGRRHIPNLHHKGGHIRDCNWKFLLVAVVWEGWLLQYEK